MTTNHSLTDKEALELKALIAPSYSELDKIEKLEIVKEYLLSLTKLELVDRADLITLPDSIGKLTKLNKLRLYVCENLTTLPESIGKLYQLEELCLNECFSLTELPESIGKLTQLTELNLSCCEKLKRLPENIGDLTQLCYMSLHLCRSLVSLPESIGNLIELIELDLSWCVDLKVLPENICNLYQLKELNLRGCYNLKTLPTKICKLEQLKILKILDCDEIKSFPECIGNMKNLEELSCNYKNIEKLPFSFINLIKLKENYLQNVLKKTRTITDKEKVIKLLEILLIVLQIREKLIIKRSMKGEPEKNVSHYTRPDIAMKILKEEKDNQNNIRQNSFQMSSVAYVNDPKEGKVIFDYFNELDELKNNHITLKPVPTLSTFIGCFTFNHDKLNHFRLYGKEQGKEATGVSIVLKSYYFSYEHQNTTTQENKNKEIDNKLPLYRCIYLNPKGKLDGKPYIQIACRDKVTFFREKDRTKESLNAYQEFIDEIKDNVTEQFEKIKTCIQSLFEKINNQDKEKLIETVSFILLPLSYMVKHSAYEEEQECRIFKFFDFNNSNDEVKIDTNNKRMYVKYLPINDYVEKIYLSPGAEQYADMFRMLTNGMIEIRSSDNPFR
ncbi:MAG: DUF2971 domain-containing protein [Neisseriaceae bacterium]|nr:DUF2971 domain-containing protein [Neisseriaceae bacterium]